MSSQTLTRQGTRSDLKWQEKVSKRRTERQLPIGHGEYTVLYPPGLAKMALGLAENLGDNLPVLCTDDIFSGGSIDETGLAWERFPSGDPNIKLRVDLIRDRHVVLLMNHDTIFLFEQLAVILFLQRFNVPHAKEQYARGKRREYDYVLQPRVQEDPRRAFIVFPDHGAHRRFYQMVHRCIPGIQYENILWIDKTRVGTFVLLADDFTNSGSTLFGGAEVIRTHADGAIKVCAYVSHYVAKYDRATVSKFVDKLYAGGALDEFHCRAEPAAREPARGSARESSLPTGREWEARLQARRAFEATRPSHASGGSRTASGVGRGSPATASRLVGALKQALDEGAGDEGEAVSEAPTVEFL
ncbi:hypothetical protein EMIHUDRAFT_109667 [Emiliania huxleyi CCMP1516]|uniref:Uncharacterized protein n=2 Tax=Emiliania huxleyi TaxID=2903 RepID=A0A0D3KPE6_EMIH1|nr:hypothetical protein EMIHUDRAFT_109667 [Emiliania huxleyi CCMP1516]EOD37631.1 hypothetical protein EMIHUDRAFT_109667 [Emiliania huxleyi CCMP1516]|eukprot:XP_005790060.1 hypothetical protein EMIHUDRAFT_109667 [Emiliania huxleyi CCMP1516]